MRKAAIKLIKAHEGYRPMVYQCTEEHDTIGIGFKVSDLFLTEDVCDIILGQILDHNHEKFSERFSWFKTLPEIAQAVLMDMVYQMGIHGVSKFKKTLKAFEIWDWETASDEMLDSLWARQTSSRAKELSNLIRNLKD